MFSQSFRRPILYQRNKVKLRSTINYCISAILCSLSVTYACVPLYKVFCQKFGWEGKLNSQLKGIQESHNDLMINSQAKNDRKIRVKLKTNKSKDLPWEFCSEHDYIDVNIGEPALCFYKAKNNSDEPMIGIATYSITPFDAAPFFNKVQCFCFEDQMLEPGEEVEMPLLFYIDGEYDLTPSLMNTNYISLHYNFLKSTNSKLVEELKTQYDLKNKEM